MLSTVSLVNPQEGSASPQVASTSTPSQVVLGRQHFLPPKQLVLRQSAIPRQLIPGRQHLSGSQCLFSPTVSSQAVSSNSSQMESTDPQAVSASVSQAVSSQEDSTSQAVSTSFPQAVSSQAVSSPQAVSADPKWSAPLLPRQLVPGKIVLLRQQALTPR